MPVTDIAIERELTIAARPETVWSFLVDPAKAVRWMGVDATIDARPGGEYRVEVLPGEVALGTVVEVDAPRRLVYTWGWRAGGKGDIPPGSSTVEFELEPAGDGTRLRFRHHGLPTDASGASHGHGWDHYLPRLADAAGGNDPGRDPWLA